jgi:hypothetical protein
VYIKYYRVPISIIFNVEDTFIAVFLPASPAGGLGLVRASLPAACAASPHHPPIEVATTLVR